MSEHYGKKIRCDRCGKEVFLKYTGEKEFDGGWTRVQCFEKKPNGWDCLSMQRHGKIKKVNLCPECLNVYDSLMDNYFPEGYEEGEGDSETLQSND